MRILQFVFTAVHDPLLDIELVKLPLMVLPDMVP